MSFKDKLPNNVIQNELVVLKFPNLWNVIEISTFELELFKFLISKVTIAAKNLELQILFFYIYLIKYVSYFIACHKIIF